MRVSPYLQPVLDAALEHAATVNVYADTAVNVTVRDRLAELRRTALQAAWAEAANLAAADETVVADEDWLAWIPSMLLTEAYNEWVTGQEPAREPPTSVLGTLYYDTQMTDTTPVPVIHPSAINTDLKPVVIDLAAPSARPDGLAALALVAAQRLTGSLTADTTERGLAELWRRAGGALRPEHRDWLNIRRHNPLGQAIAPTAVPVAPPSAPARFDVLRPGVVVPPVPAFSDGVTGLKLRYRVTETTPATAAIPGTVRVLPGAVPSRAAPGGNLVLAILPGILPDRTRFRITAVYKACVYYLPGTNTVRSSVGGYIDDKFSEPCDPNWAGGVHDVERITVQGVANHYALLVPRQVIIPATTRTVVDTTETIAYDGSAASYGKFLDLTVTDASNAAGTIDGTWINPVGESTATTVNVDAAGSPPEKFARPSWVSVAADDTATPRVQVVSVMAGVQYAPAPNARQAVTVVVSEIRSGALPWEGFAPIARTAATALVSPTAVMLARGNPVRVEYRDGAAASLAAAKALPLLASFQIAAAPQPFPIN